MGGSSEPEVPAYQGGITRIAGRDVAKNYKQGNDVISEYNPTAQEQAAFNALQERLPALYSGATTGQDFSPYAEAFKQQQLNEANRNYLNQLNTAKGALVSSGQSSSSQGLDALRPFNEAYQNQLAEISASAPILAQDLRTNDLAYNQGLLSAAQSGLSNYYGTQQQLAGQANTLSNMGNQYEQWVYPQRLAAYQRTQANRANQMSGGLQAAGTLLPIIAAPFTGGASLAFIGAGSALGGAAGQASKILA